MLRMATLGVLALGVDATLDQFSPSLFGQRGGSGTRNVVS